MRTLRQVVRCMGPIVVAAGFAVGQAHAATDVVWTFGTSGSPSGSFQYLGSDGETSVAASGWSNKRTCLDDGTCGANATTSSAGNEFGSEPLVSFGPSGLGVDRAGEEPPEHATDSNGLTEFVLLSFETAVSLKSLQINWPTSGYDTDMTVLAYTGQGIAAGANAEVADGFGDAALGTEFQWLNSSTSDLAGTVGLTNGGWKLISNLYNVSAGSMVGINNSTNVSSSYWIIGAFNSHLTACSGDGINTDGTAKCKPDYNKLFAVKGDIPTHFNTPEPTTLGLFGLGLVGLRLSRKLRHA